MPRFAVYFVPKSDETFYQFGSQILGYDLRARRSIQMPNADRLASALARLTEEFQEFTVDRVCLLVQERDGTDWFIYREFFRN